MKLKVNLKKVPLATLVAINYFEEKVSIEWCNETRLVLENDTSYSPEAFIFRYFCCKSKSEELFGSNHLQKCEVDSWITFSFGPLSCEKKYLESLNYLNNVLASVTYLVGNKLTVADIAVWSKLVSNKYWNKIVDENTTPKNVYRWFSLIGNLSIFKETFNSLPKESSLFEAKDEVTTSVRKEEGKFIELPGAETGKVVVRFPPEASGYLHIGHAKAALLNQYYRDNFKGKLIMRFDDTNPAKEKVDFEKVILEDLKLLKVEYDIFSHTSDYFDLMLDKCEFLLKSGKAYVDNTDPELMKQEREQRLNSKNRNNSADTNMVMWSEMKIGSVKGQTMCVRAKIDMQSLNGCMRDPTIYRCKNEPHPKTGSKYKVYPTYDFACPIVDSIEDVTHALRTMEYHDRDEQFFWFIDALGLRKPYIWEYSRLNMTNTVLSKRKLTWFVENGYVDGWDDPRMPTVRGVLRRGMTVEGLKQFITAQGSSRSVVFMEWDKIWSFNKKIIDPVAPRYTAIDADNKVPIFIEGICEEEIKAMKHPKNPEVGQKSIWLAPKIWIDESDALAVKEGENVTLINWGNISIKNIKKINDKVVEIFAVPNFDDKNYKKTLKFTWLPDTPKAKCIDCVCVYYDFLVSKPILGKDEDFKNFINKNTKVEVRMIGDPELANVKKSEIIQIQRKGFFICDVPYSSSSIHTGRQLPIILFFIPDGHMKAIPTKIPITLKENEEKSISKSVLSDDISLLHNKIEEQGNNVRNLKQQKVDKKLINEAVDKLLKLKKEFALLSSQDCKPGVNLTKGKNESRDPKMDAVVCSVQGELKATDALSLHNSIIEQGNTVRNLKEQKSDKKIIDGEVGKLLKLKESFKTLTTHPWKPDFDLNKFSKLDQKESKVVNQSVSSNDAVILHEKIVNQGDKVRNLKQHKAEKSVIEAEVRELLKLKGLFKTTTNIDWTPQVDPTKFAKLEANEIKTESEKANQSASSNDAFLLHEKIVDQGNKVRNLKQQKAEKSAIEAEVRELLKLKGIFKTATNMDWMPQFDPTKFAKLEVNEIKTESKVVNQSVSSNDAVILHEKIVNQGDKVRTLKQDKAEKSAIEAEVRELLKLKGLFKTATNIDWTPQVDPTKFAKLEVNEIKTELEKANQSASSNDAFLLHEKIVDQGNKVRNLKQQKAEKSVIEAEVGELLKLKILFKIATDIDWKPDVDLSKFLDLSSLESEVKIQGGIVRDLKSSGATKEAINEAVQKLLSLKSQFKTLTGNDYISTNEGPLKKSKPKKEKSEKTNKHQNSNKKESSVEKESAVKKVTRLGIEALKEENLPDWYSQVIVKGELIEYYDVSGCYILRPWSFAIWENLKDFFDKEIKALGVKNCYFPIFVSKAVLEKEKNHIADFSPEVAWVTKSGDSELAEHIAIRPTSETVMYPAYAKWIQSYRDLPIKLNQWNNVVRWEFKHPQPFLRTREFLWQEGHTAYANQEEAEVEVKQILDLYERIYTEMLAIPVVKGKKTEKEKFAGGVYTLTVEAYIAASGRAIQGATSHHLGQNFSKIFDITYEDPETQEKKLVYQNSWGFTTRTIGVMIMVHGDNRGLVLPPRVASVQVVIVPCGITATLSENEKEKLLKTCQNIEVELKEAQIRVEGDYRDNYSPGWKFNHWELKGVPVRIELGPKDLLENQIVTVRRDTGSRTSLPMSSMVETIRTLLENIQESLLNKATDVLNGNKILCKKWDQFTKNLEKKCLLLSPFCGDIDCEGEIKENSTRADQDIDSNAPSMGAKSLCIPFDQPQPGITSSDKCINPKCNKNPQFYTLFGRSY